ncbi:ATPase [bacterium J17]|nr:ATPase [bacterium J17]
MSGYSPSSQNINTEIEWAASVVERLLLEVGRSVVGQHQLRRRLITALITEGHILLEGVPGLAKTRSISALSATLDASFQRIQFTPDLLPADLTGTEIFRPKEGNFEVRQGPIFANFILADEINRAPAKVQSALLETMQERQVTIGETTFPLPRPFFVMATQNPIEQEGTYPLPEAQIDRFMMKVRVDYPSADEELEMLELLSREQFKAKTRDPVASLDDISKIIALTDKVYVDDKVKKYIIDLVWATRTPRKFNIDIENLIELGASPRATISLFQAARAEALISGQSFVVPQNVKDIAPDVLRHRVIPTYEAEAQGLSSADLIQSILDSVPVP